MCFLAVPVYFFGRGRGNRHQLVLHGRVAMMGRPSPTLALCVLDDVCEPCRY